MIQAHQCNNMLQAHQCNNMIQTHQCNNMMLAHQCNNMIPHICYKHTNVIIWYHTFIETKKLNKLSETLTERCFYRQLLVLGITLNISNIMFTWSDMFDVYYIVKTLLIYCKITKVQSNAWDWDCKFVSMLRRSQFVSIFF